MQPWSYTTACAPTPGMAYWNSNFRLRCPVADAHTQFLAALAKLVKDNELTQEEHAAVTEGLRRPWPKVQPDRARHQPPPYKEEKLL